MTLHSLINMRYKRTSSEIPRSRGVFLLLQVFNTLYKCCLYVWIHHVCDIVTTFSHLSTHLRDRNVTCCAWVCSAHRLAVHVEEPAAAASTSHHQNHLLKGSHAWLTPGVRHHWLWWLITALISMKSTDSSQAQTDWQDRALYSLCIAVVLWWQITPQ